MRKNSLDARREYDHEWWANFSVLPVVSALLVVALAAFSFAQSVGIAPEKRAALEAAVSSFRAANGIPGVSVAVIENGAKVWSAGFGSADLENYVPATSFTLYRLGSISKSLTATAAMLLWQRGKLDLDSPVQKYCPAFPQKDATITTRELLGHLGGIRYYRSTSDDDPEFGNTKHCWNPIQDGLAFFKNDPLVAKPGTEFLYSSQGFNLVGCAIEGASGENYVDYVRRNVLQPAGMNHTVVDDRFAIIAFRTRFYDKGKSGAIRNSDFLDASCRIPGGGWLSSADDLAQFALAMVNDRIVTHSTRDVMWTSQKTTGGKETHYGLGWDLGKQLGVRYIGHGGEEQGTSTFLLINPERPTAVVVLMNLHHADAYGLAATLMKIVISFATGQK
jgi:serine beta-lactamase-like protein LACTB